MYKSTEGNAVEREEKKTPRREFRSQVSYLRHGNAFKPKEEK